MLIRFERVGKPGNDFLDILRNGFAVIDRNISIGNIRDKLLITINTNRIIVIPIDNSFAHTDPAFLVIYSITYVDRKCKEKLCNRCWAGFRDDPAGKEWVLDKKGFFGQLPVFI